MACKNIPILTFFQQVSTSCIKDITITNIQPTNISILLLLLLFWILKSHLFQVKKKRWKVEVVEKKKKMKQSRILLKSSAGRHCKHSTAQHSITASSSETRFHVLHHHHTISICYNIMLVLLGIRYKVPPTFLHLLAFIPWKL